MDGEGDDGIWTAPLPSDSKTISVLPFDSKNWGYIYTYKKLKIKNKLIFLKKNMPKTLFTDKENNIDCNSVPKILFFIL